MALTSVFNKSYIRIVKWPSEWNCFNENGSPANAFWFHIEFHHFVRKLKRVTLISYDSSTEEKQNQWSL